VRTLHILDVELIVQFDLPSSERKSLHQVRRSAWTGAEGRALLFLMENARKFLEYLVQEKIYLREIKFDRSKVIHFDFVDCKCFEHQPGAFENSKRSVERVLNGI
jgi:superfamily II DNA/RNA helicase